MEKVFLWIMIIGSGALALICFYCEAISRPVGGSIAAIAWANVALAWLNVAQFGGEL